MSGEATLTPDDGSEEILIGKGDQVNIIISSNFHHILFILHTTSLTTLYQHNYTVGREEKESEIERERRGLWTL